MVTVCSDNKTKHMNTLCGQSVELLGMFAQLQKPTNSPVVSVSPSARNAAISTGRIVVQFHISDF
jgi:hypothetical protein